MSTFACRTISIFSLVKYLQIFCYFENWAICFPSVQFSSVAQLFLLCSPMDCSMPGLPVHHQLLELAQTHNHWISDATEPSHPLLSPSPPALNLSQHQGLFKWVSSSHQVAKVLELQPQHQSCRWIFSICFPYIILKTSPPHCLGPLLLQEFLITYRMECKHLTMI